MDTDGKTTLKRNNPSYDDVPLPPKMTKTDTGSAYSGVSNTGSAYSGVSNTGYNPGQGFSNTTTQVRKPQKKPLKVEPDTSNPVIAQVQNILHNVVVSNPVIAQVQNILHNVVGTGLNPYATKDAITKLKEVLGPTPSNYYEQKVPKGKQLCRHYSKGYCQRGTACSFLHSDIGPNVNEQVFSGLQELGVGQNYYPGYGGQYMQQGQQGYQGQGQGPGYQGASGSWYPQGYTWGQQNTGNQWGGNNDGTSSTAMKPTQSGEQQKEIGPQEYPGPKEKRVCRHFAAGHCRRGDTCSFLHPGVGSSQSQQDN